MPEKLFFCTPKTVVMTSSMCKVSGIMITIPVSEMNSITEAAWQRPYALLQWRSASRKHLISYCLSSLSERVTVAGKTLGSSNPALEIIKEHQLLCLSKLLPFSGPKYLLSALNPQPWLSFSSCASRAALPSQMPTSVTCALSCMISLMSCAFSAASWSSEILSLSLCFFSSCSFPLSWRKQYFHHQMALNYLCCFLNFMVNVGIQPRIKFIYHLEDYQAILRKGEGLNWYWEVVTSLSKFVLLCRTCRQKSLNPNPWVALCHYYFDSGMCVALQPTSGPIIAAWALSVFFAAGLLARESMRSRTIGKSSSSSRECAGSLQAVSTTSISKWGSIAQSASTISFKSLTVLMSCLQIVSAIFSLHQCTSYKSRSHCATCSWRYL